MTNPFKLFEKRDWVLWITSMVIVGVSNIFSPGTNWLTVMTTVLGVTCLVFSAKGHQSAPLLSVIFCILYAIIAKSYHYWGEMMTFLGLSAPMSAWAWITWLRNPSKREGEVKIRRLSGRACLAVLLLAIPVTAIFGWILWKLDTPYLVVSTISVTASYLGATFLMLRSSWYGLGYAFNDVVLIVLWILASLTDPVYIPVVVNFVIFLINDLYAYYSWRQREADQ